MSHPPRNLSRARPPLRPPSAGHQPLPPPCRRAPHAQSRHIAVPTRRNNNAAKQIPESIPPRPTTREKLQKIDFEGQHEAVWGQFEESCKEHFRFNLFNLMPAGEEGKLLLKDGYFLTCWLKAVSLNPFINFNLVLKQARELYYGDIQQHKQVFEQFYQERKERENKQREEVLEGTPVHASVSNLQGSKLKRSILKNSKRKVQFGSDEIIYPVLADYNKQNIFHPKLPPTLEERKSAAQQQHRFLLDYYEINDLYLLEEVEIVGLVREFQGYAVFQVKEKFGGREVTCLAVHRQGEQQVPPDMGILREIEREYFITGFLELEGRAFAEAWVDSLPLDKQQD